jgi:tetratricopeptide (TPR) repeat protein
MILAVLVVVGLAAIGGCRPAETAAQLYSQGTHAANSADFGRALQLTERCLELEPDHVEALLLHGYCCYQLMTPEQMEADPSSVLAYVERAASLAPERFIAQYIFGWMLFESRQYGRALVPLEKAYELREQCPEHTDSLLVLLSLCCVHQNLVRGRRYLQVLRTYKGFERSPLLYNALGVLHTKQMDAEAALSYFLEALTRDDHHPVVLQNLAVLYDDHLRRPEQAMQYYRRAIGARQAMRDSTRQDAIRRRLKQLVAERRRPTSP